MDILDQENYREEYQAFLHSLLTKEWTIKIQHSKYRHVKTKHTFAFAVININPVIIHKDKRYCTVSFDIHSQNFKTIIYTPLSMTIEDFLMVTYNKLCHQITNTLLPEVWAKCNVDVKLDFKQIKASVI